MELYGNHKYRGKLFVAEGVDGSGKSTQLALLRQWLESERYIVVSSEWNSSPLVKETTTRGQKKRILTPTTFSLIHATDFADRIEREILPPLKAGAIVLADRYIYTAFARDVVHGVDAEWVRKMYRYAIKPTMAFYFRLPIDVAMRRTPRARGAIKYYDAGMNLSLSTPESFRVFQRRIIDEYDKMVKEFGLTVIDATQPIALQQSLVRRLVRVTMAGIKKSRVRTWVNLNATDAKQHP